MANMPISFAVLLDRPDIWRGQVLSRAGTPTISCGFPGLDAELPGRGWPAGALTEILPAHEGIGELRLLGPALAGLSKRGLRPVWIAPPHLPYAPALAAAGIDVANLVIVRTA
ncbi:MAG: SOS cell division inhibitor SulA, partial [Betaproteobacteria bacterium]